jgi:hypothetical protein
MIDRRARYFLGIISTTTGAALLVYFLAGISLALSILFIACLAVVCAVITWQRLTPQGRSEVQARAKAGFLAGVVATLGYDISRFLLVRVAHFAIWPFETFRLFGELILGSHIAPPTTVIVGTIYHLTNGISFAVAYTLILGRRGWLFGVAWAFGLEFLMVSFYPGWLGLKALDEFLQVSVLGHFVYGSILGLVSKKLLDRASSVRQVNED